jgi:hypothetical protein
VDESGLLLGARTLAHLAVDYLEDAGKNKEEQLSK